MAMELQARRAEARGISHSDVLFKQYSRMHASFDELSNSQGGEKAWPLTGFSDSGMFDEDLVSGSFARAVASA
jgi:hypothetical protein